MTFKTSSFTLKMIKFRKNENYWGVWRKGPHMGVAERYKFLHTVTPACTFLMFPSHPPVHFSCCCPIQSVSKIVFSTNRVKSMTQAFYAKFMGACIFVFFFQFLKRV